MDNKKQENINENSAIGKALLKFGKFTITAIVQYIINNPTIIREFTDKMMAQDDPKVQDKINKRRPYGYREI